MAGTKTECSRQARNSVPQGQARHVSPGSSGDRFQRYATLFGHWLDWCPSTDVTARPDR